MKRNAVGGLTRDTSFDLVLSIILRDGSGLSRGEFGPEPLPWTPCTAALIDCRSCCDAKSEPLAAARTQKRVPSVRGGPDRLQNIGLLTSCKQAGRVFNPYVLQMTPGPR